MKPLYIILGDCMLGFILPTLDSTKFFLYMTVVGCFDFRESFCGSLEECKAYALKRLPVPTRELVTFR